MRRLFPALLLLAPLAACGPTVVRPGGPVAYRPPPPGPSWNAAEAARRAEIRDRQEDIRDRREDRRDRREDIRDRREDRRDWREDQRDRWN